jgi:hypothetical protein
VRYVEFSVDAADVQMYVDSVVAVPEPVAGGLLLVVSCVTLSCRSRRRMINA